MRAVGTMAEYLERREIALDYLAVWKELLPEKDWDGRKLIEIALYAVRHGIRYGDYKPRDRTPLPLP